MRDSVKKLNIQGRNVFKENKIKHVHSFCILIPAIDVTVRVDFRSGQGSTAVVKLTFLSQTLRVRALGAVSP